MKLSSNNYADMDFFDLCAALTDRLSELGFHVVDRDVARPWGAFLRLHDDCADRFIEEFFPNGAGIEVSCKPRSPKLLIIRPEKRLSWQYHFRRDELWCVQTGRIGVVISENDEHVPVRVLSEGGFVKVRKQQRHRIVGLTDVAVVAEIWEHTEDLLSDEQDIVRLQDDFGRQGA